METLSEKAAAAAFRDTSLKAEIAAERAAAAAKIARLRALRLAQEQSAQREG
jgi:hypothetical protein